MYDPHDCSVCKIIMITDDPTRINMRREPPGMRRVRTWKADSSRLAISVLCSSRRIRTLHSFNSVPYFTQIAYSPSPTMSTEKHSITLYCEGTPNPLKISIALEELGLKYNVGSYHHSRTPLRNKNNIKNKNP